LRLNSTDQDAPLFVVGFENETIDSFNCYSYSLKRGAMGTKSLLSTVHLPGTTLCFGVSDDAGKLDRPGFQRCLLLSVIFELIIDPDDPLLGVA
jgi:hypothetical protein